MRLLLGVDSHDSSFAGCTTHFMVFLLKKLSKDYGFKLKLKSLPKLVRLNPYIPWKTRGNASVGAEIELESRVDPEKFYYKVEYYSKRYSSLTKSSEASILVLEYDEAHKFKQTLVSVYYKCLTDVLPLNTVLKKLECIPNSMFRAKKGVIGATAAIGFMLEESSKVTYELIIYRSIRNICKKRLVDEESVARAERCIKTLFNNYDYKKKKAVAIPRGPDPVLIGIRGVDPLDLLKSLSIIKILEEYKLWCIFETNQHTDAHAIKRRISDLRVYQTCLIKGFVASKPRVLRGGHVAIEVADSSGTVNVMIYKPTHPVSVVASKLHPGDEVIILGGVMPSLDHGFVVNTEKLIITNLAPSVIVLNPKCPRCGSRMKSLGSKGGFKCIKCSFKVEGAIEKEYILSNRELSPGEYLPPPGRYTHLTKPPGINPLKASRAVEKEVLDALIKKLFSA